MSAPTMPRSATDDRIAAEAQTWNVLLSERAQRTPDAPAITFLEDGEDDARTLSFGELDQRARALAARIAESGSVGDRVLLLVPPGLDFVAAFFACLYAGRVAVPVPPPARKRGLPRLLAIASDAKPSAIVTTRGFATLFTSVTGEDGASLASLRWIEVEDAFAERGSAFRMPAVRAEAIAFLQYTSGSTGTPKGVVLTHQNLLANERAIARAFDHTHESVVVGWLPPFHDMGLIGNVLQPIFVGGRSVQMAPQHFLLKPLRWLAAITRYRATTSGGPNFAYELCVEKISLEQRAALDLRCWQLAFNGAEPVRAATLSRFAEAFALAGFDRRAFYPCYGLAEATLLVSGGVVSAPPVTCDVDVARLEAGELYAVRAGAQVESRSLVGCGQPQGAEVRIVDQGARTLCTEGKVGEVWVRSASVAGGYWNRATQSAAAFDARLADGDGPFLRTGDLGALVGGELFVTGRHKDLIIVRGRNLYPQDLESAAEQSHPSLRSGGAAAFSLAATEDGDERIVIVQEAGASQDDARRAIAAAIRAAIAEEFELSLHAVVLIKRGSLPRTTSGKVQRNSCRERFLAGTLDALLCEVGEQPTSVGEPPRSPLERQLAAVFCEVLERDQVTRDDTFVALGGDSLAAAQVSARVRELVGLPLHPAQLFETRSLAELAALLEDGRAPCVPDAVPAKAAQSMTPRPERLPLSLVQERLWFLEQLAGGQPVYHVAGALRLRGALDGEALRRAIELVRERHEALRTRFVSDGDGAPRQAIEPACALVLPVVDARTQPETEAFTRVVREPFDLSREAVRWALFRTREDEHALVFVAHHLVIDGYALRVLVRELAAAYRAHQAGERPAFVPLGRQPADYALSERAEDERGWARSLAYFTRRFERPVPPLALLTDRPRPPVQTYVGARARFRLSRDLLTRVHALGRAQDATLFVTFTSALSLLLHRYTGQADLCVGTPVVARPSVELESVVGCFLNTLALRLDLSGNPDVERLLARVRQCVVEAQRHADVPFERVLAAVRPERDLARAPLFQVMISLQPPRESLPKLPNLEMTLEQLDTGAAQTDLSLDLIPLADGGFEAAWEYNRDLFDADTIEGLSRHFVRTLEAMADAPRLRVSELPLFACALPAAGESAVPWAVELPAHLAFEQAAHAHPTREALVAGAARLTYAELNVRSNQLAHHLRARGVRPETRVGLWLERSPDLLVAALAVLKAGGCYVPLDSGHPRERVAFMLEDARISLLISNEQQALGLPANHGELVLLDRDARAIESEAAADPTVAGQLQQLAYLLYTSGSTGQPKGVMVAHGSLTQAASAWRRLYRGEGEAPRLLSLASPAFDVWTADWVRALTTGGTLILAPRELAFDPQALTALMRRERVSVIDVVPALGKLLTDAWLREGEGVPSLRLAIVGSDVCPAGEFEALRRVCPSEARLLSCYGVTEATIDSTFHEGMLDVADAAGPVPLGWPLANTRVYVLDAHLQPLPSGVPGELAIGGRGIARGYFRQPGRTAARFIPDPFSSEPGARLYLTGDRVRRLADGALAFLGRLDDQVKVRGMRIETGEVEACLRQHPEVRAAAVVAREQRSGQHALVAYLALAERSAVTAARLREFVRARLPEAMVPAGIVVLAELPLSENGKIDRRALPAWDEASHGEQEPACVSAGTPLETALVEIWGALLPARAVSVHDNFFDLGGHSLLLAQVQSRLRALLGREVPMLTLLEHPTIARLASALASGPPSEELPAPARSSAAERRRAEVFARRRGREEGEP